MDRKTFTNPEVVGMLNRNFIPIRVDADRDKAAASLYRVTGLPDIWFLAETGEVIGHRPGFIPADQMLKVLGAALAGPVK
jgi:thioredoxin-related protein